MTRLPPLSPAATMRWDAVRRLLPDEHSRVLEVGAGMGAVAARLSEHHTYLGYEPDATSYRVARDRLSGYEDSEIRNETVDGATTIPGPFDVLAAFEVLEHLDDDKGALCTWLESIRDGGLVVISVPAHRSRFACCDTQVGHRRRYDRQDLEDLISGVGLTTLEMLSYGFPITRVTEWVRNILCERRPSPESGTQMSGRLYQPIGIVGRITTLLLWPFCRLQRLFFKSDLGSGWVVAARKPS